MSFHQVIVPFALLPSLLPLFKGITLFPQKRYGTTPNFLSPLSFKSGFPKIRIFYCNGATDNQFCSTRRCHALWIWVTLKVFLLWEFQAKIRSTACSAVCEGSSSTDATQCTEDKSSIPYGVSKPSISFLTLSKRWKASRSSAKNLPASSQALLRRRIDALTLRSPYPRM